MSTVLSASAPTSFEIKSAQLPLVALLLKTADLGQLAEEMTQRYGDIPDFFDHDPLLVDLGPLQAGEQADSPVDFPALVSLLRGQDTNWDLRNYHLHNAWALIEGRVGVDLAPAQMQSYFAPLLDVPYFLLVQYASPTLAKGAGGKKLCPEGNIFRSEDSNPNSKLSKTFQQTVPSSISI